jgi:hypothetical protein
MIAAKNCELCIFSLSELSQLGQLPAKPTVCLLIFSRPLLDGLMSALVQACVNIGAVAFMSYGDLANDIEDQVDWVLESQCSKGSAVLTTAHTDEDIEDVAYFFKHAAYVGAQAYRCIVITDVVDENGILLLSEVRKLFDKPEF